MSIVAELNASVTKYKSKYKVFFSYEFFFSDFFLTYYYQHTLESISLIVRFACANFMIISFQAVKLRRGGLHTSAQMIVGLRGPGAGWQNGGTCEYVCGVFCSCQGDKKFQFTRFTSWELVERQLNKNAENRRLLGDDLV